MTSLVPHATLPPLVLREALTMTVDADLVLVDIVLDRGRETGIGVAYPAITILVVGVAFRETKPFDKELELIVAEAVAKD